MPSSNVVVQVIVVLLVLLQCGLALTLAYRIYLLSRTYKGAEAARRRVVPANFLKVHRGCIFLMTILQCIRCIDPFGSNLIFSYDLLRFVQVAVTISIYFEYSATSYVVMDTLYACALKRTPSWLAVVVTILPCTEFLVGFGMWALQYAFDQQWVAAVISLYVVFAFSVNLTTYNVSGIKLIRILLDHQKGNATGEDISGSESAKPFAVVIRKTIKSMIFLTVPSLVVVILFLVTGLGALNTRPLPVYDPNAPNSNMLITLFAQLILGLVFTRFCWITKAALDAEIVAKTSSPPSSHNTPSSERTTRARSRAELKDRAIRMSQSPNPRPSEEISPNSRPEVEMQEKALVTVEVSASKSDVYNSVFNEADIV